MSVSETNIQSMNVLTDKRVSCRVGFSINMNDLWTKSVISRREKISIERLQRLNWFVR